MNSTMEWVGRLGFAFNVNLREQTLEEYAEAIDRHSPTEFELLRLKRDLVDSAAENKMPTAAYIVHRLRRMRGYSLEYQEPNWELKNENGRTYARKSGGFHPQNPTQEDYDKWEREACSTEEGIAIFRREFAKAGGNLAKLKALEGAIPAIQSDSRSDYDDSIPF